MPARSCCVGRLCSLLFLLALAVLPAACHRIPKAAGSFTVGGRGVHVWTPQHHDPAKAYPVVLMLHGWRGTGAFFEEWFEMEKYTDVRAIVVYPDAREGVWDFHGDTDLDFLATVLDEVAMRWKVDRSRVLAFGFSFGAKMAQHLGCKRPDLVKAVAAGAGSWASKVPACQKPLPVIMVQRTTDTNESMTDAKAAAERWASFEGCAAVPAPSPLGNGCQVRSGCQVPGSVTFCEDTHSDPKWKDSYNHTVREEYRALVWRWFAALPAHATGGARAW